jgi:LPS export ABC transporter permease LptF
MRAARTITTYVLREVATYTLLGVAAIIVVAVTRNLVRALADLSEVGLAFSDILLVVRLLGTMLVMYALPIAYLFGVLLAIGRMAADVEITAMRACGVGLRTLTLPVVVVGLILSGITLHFSVEVEPAARREMRAAIKTLLVHGGVVEPGKFRRFGGNRLFYVGGRDDAGGLREIFVSDRSSPERPFTVFAKTGRITLDEDRGELVVELFSGDVHVESPPGEDRYQRIAFERFAYGLDVTELLDKGRLPKPKEMSMAELEAAIERIALGETTDLREPHLAYDLHWHRRVAGPLAPALFGLVGVPIAMRRTRGARSMGMLWCAGLAFGYYLIQTFCEFLMLQGWFPPAVAAWIPNAGIATLGIALLVHARRAGT